VVVPRPTQPSISPGSVNEDHLRLERQRQVWFISLVDKRADVRVNNNHAIYILRFVEDSYLASRSAVIICALDVNKAFDNVNHYCLFNAYRLSEQVATVIRKMV